MRFNLWCRYVIISCFLFSYLVSLPILAKTSISLSKTQMSVGEAIDITIISDRSGNITLASLQPLLQHFNVLGESRVQQVRILNGKQVISNQLSLRVSAKHRGNFTVAPMNIHGVMTKTLNFNVLAQAANTQVPKTSSSTNRPASETGILLRGFVDKAQTYVGSEVIYTLQILRKYRLLRGQITPLQIAGIKPKTLVAEKRSQTSYLGENYEVIEWLYGFIPKNSGELVIPSINFSGIVQNPQGQRQRINLATDALSMQILPQPSTWPNTADWLPAKQLSIWEKWQPSADQWRVNEPITRIIEIEALGVNAAQLPNLQIATTADISIYPLQPKRSDTISVAGNRAKMSISVDYIANSSGQFTLPGVQLAWFDVNEQQLRYASLPTRQVQVLSKQQALNIRPIGVDAAPTTSVAPSQNTSVQEQITTTTSLKQLSLIRVQPWLLIALLLYTLVVILLTWLGTRYWQQWHRHRQQAKAQHATTKFTLPSAQTKQLQKLYQQKDLVGLQQLLLRLSRQQQLCKQSPSLQHNLQALLLSLQQYELPNKKIFQQFIQAWQQLNIKTTPAKSALPPLFPNS